MIAGAPIHRLEIRALHFDRWNLTLGFTSLVFVPGILFMIAFFTRSMFHMTKEVIIISIMVGVMPVRPLLRLSF
jgi:hypothetical protein